MSSPRVTLMGVSDLFFPSCWCIDGNPYNHKLPWLRHSFSVVWKLEKYLSFPSIFVYYCVISSLLLVNITDIQGAFCIEWNPEIVGAFMFFSLSVILLLDTKMSLIRFLSIIGGFWAYLFSLGRLQYLTNKFIEIF